MFQLEKLPRITFVRPERSETLELALCGTEIRELVDALGQVVAPGSTVGLIFRTGPELVISWLAVMASGRVPLMLQYPTEKQNGAYWKESVAHTMRQAGVAALLCGHELTGLRLDELVLCFAFSRQVSESAEGNVAGPDMEVSFPGEGRILQLSSGTTGQKKAIAFSFEALRHHAARYNEVLGLTGEDRVVSWLPLYHDMGFIACFVMPLLLGVRVTMLDPMDWVREPGLLFRTMREHGSTVCWMPNFGFEVMAKVARPELVAGGLSTMRQWISCSEPTYAETLERFAAATGVSPQMISTCYGMAENVFAVSQSDGLEILEREGRRYVSCGRAVPGTEVQVVDGELRVRSGHSIEHYEGGADVRDEDGFYATGDLGFVTETGKVVVTGRKGDLANIGGRKYLLNDLDFALGRVFPDVAGRIASLAAFDMASGTEKALFLIESERFWELNRAGDRGGEPLRLVQEATGIEWCEVRFVPRHFITKTSSGKINRRRTLEDWQAVEQACVAEKEANGPAGDWRSELRSLLPGLRFDRPVGDELDSLGQLMMRMFCEERGIAYRPESAAEEMLANGKRQTEAVASGEVFRIVALMDGWRLGFEAERPTLDDAFLRGIEKVVGCPVEVEHVCVPPAPILLSDLVFCEYFLPRVDGEAYLPLRTMVEKIRGASLILVDDEDNFRTPPFCAYPRLSHRFQADPEAELLGHRMQRYTQNHHLLPREVVLGREVRPETINPSLRALERYLNVPVLRIAFHEAFREHTSGWEFQAYRRFASDGEKVGGADWVPAFQNTLVAFLESRRGQWRTHKGEGHSRVVLLDTPHFCSFLLNRMAVDFVTRIYDSFCIVGTPSSLPYLTRRLDSLGKRYVFSTETTPAGGDFECLLLTGGVGGRMPAVDRPVFDFVHAREEGAGGGRPHNVTPEIEHSCPPLAACDEAVFRQIRPQHGVLIGNFLLNHTMTMEEHRRKDLPT